MKYRPEIDGLRTIAIMSVLLYHAELFIGKTQLFQGGYQGVDIFFVISGYLITSLILIEQQSTGSFSFLNFYERRARRLLPALFTVMLASLPVAWIVLLPTQLVDFSKSLISSIFFASNFYWQETMQEYGAESALLKPFLHTWSLAVEEQFYLLFPIILLGIYRFLNKYTLIFLKLFFLISLILAEFANEKYPSFSFYMLPTRFWELMVGALLAHGMIIQQIKTDAAVWQKILPSAGMILIIYSILFIPFNERQPGFITLSPVFGTVLVIWFANTNDFVTKVLSSKVFVAIGLISYSLYLWHYPIFAFGRIIVIQPDNLSKLLWIALSIVLSFLTYRLLERPFRNRNIIKGKPFILTICLASMIVIGYSEYSIQKDGLKKERFPELIEIYGKTEFDNKILARNTWNILNRLAVKNGYPPKTSAFKSSRFEREALWYTSNPNTTKVLVLGNSHARDLFNAFYQNAKLFKDFEFARYGILFGAKDIEQRLSELFEAPNFLASDIVMISSSMSFTSESVVSISKLPHLLYILQNSGKRVVLTSIAPRFKSDDTTVFDDYIQNLHGDFSSNEINSLLFQHKEDLSILNLTLKNYAVEFNVKYLDKDDVICNPEFKMCYGVTPDGYKTFLDSTHWTLEGAKYFGKLMYKRDWLKNIN